MQEMKLTFNLCFPSYAALTRARMIGFGAFTWVLIKIPVPAKAIIVNRNKWVCAAVQSGPVLRACTV